MMRALWTAASGMTSQQTNVDTIANNLANINTTGYKKESVEFKSLLYQQIQNKATDKNGDAKPVGIQVGLGVRNAAISASYAQGSLTASNGEFDFGIEGEGFFTVQLEDGTTGYTRNGNFGMSVGQDGLVLSTTNANPVLDVNGDPIVFPLGTDTSKMEFDSYGNILLLNAAGTMQATGKQIGLAIYGNSVGLQKGADSMLKETAASGEARLMNAEQIGSKIMRKYLESSNVQAADEMVNLIVAQRAYEMNSKAITASDQMLQQANNLRS